MAIPEKVKRPHIFTNILIGIAIAFGTLTINKIDNFIKVQDKIERRVWVLEFTDSLQNSKIYFIQTSIDNNNQKDKEQDEQIKILQSAILGEKSYNFKNMKNGKENN